MAREQLRKKTKTKQNKWNSLQKCWETKMGSKGYKLQVHKKWTHMKEIKNLFIDAINDIELWHTTHLTINYNEKKNPEKQKSSLQFTKKNQQSKIELLKSVTEKKKKKKKNAWVCVDFILSVIEQWGEIRTSFKGLHRK